MIDRDINTLYVVVERISVQHVKVTVVSACLVEQASCLMIAVDLFLYVSAAPCHKG